MQKNILGKVFNFSCSTSTSKLLNESLEDYSSSNSNQFDVKVNIFSSTSELENVHLESKNPSIHGYKKNVLFSVINGNYVWWEKKKDYLEVSFIFEMRSGLINKLRMLRKIEFSTEVERFEQILHELVLVPSMYFFDDIMPVHASSFDINGKTILMAGTGGVGKSSSMLAIKDLPNTKFIADDIVSINTKGQTNGNMAWPKIYAYNCQGSNLEKEILSGRGLLDLFHFHYRKSKDLASVRRKIKPKVLFGEVKPDCSDIDTVNILFRNNIDDFVVSDVDKKTATELLINIMCSEYQIFHTHIHWHVYNARANNHKPMIDFDKVLDSWRVILNQALENKTVKVVNIPFNYPHDKYLNSIKSLFS
ncbi:hypothetical protein QI724_004497 [Vibrio parahaemolyticus]|nr:hypothetical protein [Vibrio parahaemolyticus]